MIRIAGLAKSFGDIVAIRGVDLHINRGEIFGIVGPDGAGKSTLLRILSTILDPDAGSVLIDGISAAEQPYRIKDNLAYMPQRFGLYEDLTVEENIYFFGRLFGVGWREIQDRIPRLYEFSRLGPFHDRLAGKLSGGMKQKLGLACCLVHSPGLILLDEPTNGVDPVSRREFWKILYDLLRDRVTIVVSTAYLDEAERCNRIALMYRGSFIRVGSPRQIKKDMKKVMIDFTVDNPRHAEMVLSEFGDFPIVIRSGDSLRVFADSASKTIARMRALFKKHQVGILSARERDPGLEDCFMQIVSEEVTHEHAERGA